MNSTINKSKWDYKEEDIAKEFLFFNVLKDGRVHILAPPITDKKKIIPPLDDLTTGVKIKDVVISSNVTVRIFLPAVETTSNKLPLLFYIHGGGFCMCSAFSAEYTHFVSHLVAQFNVLAVSVEYGLFPLRPIPACYEDSWDALRWIASHADPSFEIFNLAPHDPWIKDYGDLKRIFVAGDSAGGNISHTLLARIGKIGLPKEAKVQGMILIHPYFGHDDKMWMYMCPTNEGPCDPRMKPAKEDLVRLACERVFVSVAEKDVLREAGKMYVEELRKSGWRGTVDIVENKDREHCFNVSNYMDPEAVATHQRIKSFIYHGKAHM